jgi:hypothetical protein
MTEQKFRLEYDGSVGWLVFWAIVLFPVALVLLLTAGRFTMNGKVFAIRYDGSRGWLAFWLVVFFPVGLILLFVNGFSVTLRPDSLSPPASLTGP